MPKGIPYIIGNEAAERYSFYGMKTILVMFMTNHLMMGENTATVWYHTFTMAAYFLPVLGSFLADIFWGKYKTIIILSIVYCIGHGVLALFESENGLLFGLGIIAIGAGGIKPSVSSHVGDQFNKSNARLIGVVFGWFYISINVGAFIAQATAPLILEEYSPAWAFGIPGILMALATIVFWFGRKVYIAIPPIGWKKYKADVFNKSTLKIIGNILLVFFFISFFWSLFDQTGSTWLLQARNDLMIKDFNIFGWEFTLLPAQMQAANPFLILLFTPLFSYVIYPLVGRKVRLTPLRKIGFGMFVTIISFLIIAQLEEKIQAGQQVHIMWQFVAYMILTAAEVMVSITALEMSYTNAPRAVKSLIMALFWATIAIGNFIAAFTNYVIVEPVQMEAVYTGQRTIIDIDDYDMVAAEGNKIEFDVVDPELLMVRHLYGKTDTVPFSGTFVVAEVDKVSNQYEIVDINKKPVVTIGLPQYKLHQQQAKINPYTGSSYFYLFAIMMFVASSLFVVVAVFYKGKTYIHD